jgi:predicted alpha/beta-fold hydrolase
VAVNKFAEALTIGGESVLLTKEAEVPDLTTTAGKEQAAAMKQNAITMANLTMAFTSEAMMGLVFKAKTQDWPSVVWHIWSCQASTRSTTSRHYLKSRTETAFECYKNEEE